MRLRAHRPIAAFMAAAGLTLTLVSPAQGRAARPCFRAEAQTYWVQQCSPYYFSEIECLGPGYDNSGLHVLVGACYPTAV